ncbi:MULTISPECIES: AraC family transcriptional regulator [Nocardia]|uniref:AraC family transcriptional regulator n=2 Tax=Nocardia TaxID=1817 RepID=A0A2T2YQ00_9NOCA|nr:MULTISPECIES: AraC family transcriptional regulator [Nocardia]PSR57568.1 AraC family transcriptional regulator [Nocardia nova]
MDYVRSAGLRGLRAVVAELGGDAEQYTRWAGLPAAALDSDDVLVPGRAMAELLEFASADLGCPDLGLRLAARQDLTMLGSLAVAMQHSATLGDAMECTSRYLFVHARSLRLTVGADPRGNRDVAGLYYGPATAEGPVQGTDLGLAFTHRAVTYLHKGAYGLAGVELPYRPPASGRIYQEFFGCPVYFGKIGHRAAVLRVPRKVLSFKLIGVNDNLRRLALAFLAEQAPAPTATSMRSEIAPRVRAIVRESVGTRTVDVAAVARLLSMHERTLQRRLAQENTTFAHLLDDVRRETAHRLLTTTDLPLGQVAGMVGFAEQSGLSRAARRWWNVAPREVRTRHSAERSARFLGACPAE